MRKDMKRRNFVHRAVVGGMLGISATREGQGQIESTTQEAFPATISQKLVTTPLVLMAPQEDGVVAVWGVSELCKGRIEWEGPSGTSGVASTDDFGMVPQGTKIIQVHLSGLKPGTKYRVRSVTTTAKRSESEASEWKVFHTLDSKATTTRFAVWNDTHDHLTTIQALDDMTSSADFLVWNGDTCNDWLKEETMIPTVLHPGKRDITDERPLMLVWGNHDVRGPWAFQLPQMVATPTQRPFYAFRSGPVAVVCLHTGEDKPDSHPSFNGRVSFDELRAEQTAWLRKTITQPDFQNAPYRIVFCHILYAGRLKRFPTIKTEVMTFLVIEVELLGMIC